MALRYACECNYQCVTLPNEVPDEHSDQWQSGYQSYRRNQQNCRDAASFMTKILTDEGLTAEQIDAQPFTCPLLLQREGFVERVKASVVEVENA